MKKYYNAFLMLFASVTVAAENKPLSAMKAMNQLNDRAGYCSRNNRNSEIIAINSPTFDALTNQQKQHTILLINNNLYYSCIDAVNARLIFKNALIREGINYKQKQYNVYLNDYPLPDDIKQFKSDYADEIKAITKSLNLPHDYGSFDTLATINKYAPIH